LLPTDKGNWTDRGYSVNLKSTAEYELPEGWAWVDEWDYIGQSEGVNVDKGGWQYAILFQPRSWSNTVGAHSVRRRIWRRTMKRILDVPTPDGPPSDEDVSAPCAPPLHSVRLFARWQKPLQLFLINDASEVQIPLLAIQLSTARSSTAGSIPQAQSEGSDPLNLSGFLLKAASNVFGSPTRRWFQRRGDTLTYYDRQMNFKVPPCAPIH
jgi:hypothetical protein